MSDIGNMVLLRSLVSDEAAKEKLGEFIEQQKKLDQRYVDIQTESDKNAEILRQVREERAAAEAARADLESREAKLKSDTADLASALQAHQDEARRFADMRQVIEKGHDAKAAMLAEHESALANRAVEADRVERDHAAREAQLSAAEDLNANRMAAAKAFIALG